VTLLAVVQHVVRQRGRGVRPAWDRRGSSRSNAA
jgi:hypothetical protein